ncbi:hypothetical protein BTA51_25540 [Hahella sp. CCB-MM4]|uniref:glycosyltransferase n=1 Tax=Hahella sp. (strain CCB-MM4) TaxID=1926491 RepID=UPI000B9A4BF1|nr:glycosyltransferase [Hahella sp. CCB-MM4]OZG70500.1 hypothetical protein BTA51_25540 [Hahella sp. CCB-MM4]
MNVLFVSRSRSKGMPSPLILAQGESLESQGVNVQYYTIDGGGVADYLKSVVHLRRKISKEYFDVVHAHYGLSGLIAGLGCGRRSVLVLSLMGTDLYGKRKADGRLSAVGIVVRAISRIVALIFSREVIVKSEDMLAMLPDKVKGSVIPNGVNFDRFECIGKSIARKRLDLSPHQKVILFPSDPSRPEKNYLLAQKSLQKLGDRSVALIPIYNLSQSELAQWYCAADVMLLTSLYEGSPNVVKEAMACRCPIVATDVGDVSWLLEDIQGCFVVRQDAEDVASALEKALAFAENFDRTSGRERLVSLKLDSLSVASRLLDVYNRSLMKV